MVASVAGQSSQEEFLCCKYWVKGQSLWGCWPVGMYGCNSHPVTLQVSLKMTTRDHLPNNTCSSVYVSVCVSVQQSHVERQTLVDTETFIEWNACTPTATYCSVCAMLNWKLPVIINMTAQKNIFWLLRGSGQWTQNKIVPTAMMEWDCGSFDCINILVWKHRRPFTDLNNYWSYWSLSQLKVVFWTFQAVDVHL